MPRELPSGTDDAVEAVRLAPIGMVHLKFDSGSFRVWTGWGTLRYGDDDAFTDHTDFSDGTGFTDSGTATWYGIGDLGSIGVIEETTEVRAVGVEIGLSGIREEVLDLALAENWQGREGHIYLAVLDSEGALVGAPVEIFGGSMDQMRLTEGISAAIALTLESEMIDLERTRPKRFTPEQQRAAFPGDAGCDYVSSLQQKEFKWGRGF